MPLPSTRQYRMPESFPEAPANTDEMVVRHVKPRDRSGRGDFWCPNGHGYTDQLDEVGLLQWHRPTIHDNYTQVEVGVVLAWFAEKASRTFRALSTDPETQRP